MQHGTYQEALAAGFSQKKAAFLSRLACDTKNEVYEHYSRIADGASKSSPLLPPISVLTLLMFCIGILLAIAWPDLMEQGGNSKGSVIPIWTPWRTGRTEYVRINLREVVR